MDSGKMGAMGGMVTISIMLGLMGIFTRFFYEQGLQSTDITFIRASVTVLMLLPIMLVYREDMRLGKGDIPLLIFFGLCRFGCDVTLFYAQNTITLALATLLQMTFPFYVLVISLFFFKERVTYVKMLSALVATGGAVLITGVFMGEVDANAGGILAAMLSGLLVADFIIGGAIGTKRGIKPAVFVFYAYVVSTVASIPFAHMPAIADVVVGYPGIFFLIGIGLLMTVIPEYVTVWSNRRLDASTISIISVLELASAVVVGAMVYGEDLSTKDYAGVALVMASVVLLNLHLGFSFRRYLREHGLTREYVRAMMKIK